MSEKNRKTLFIFGFIILGIVLIVGFILLFVSNDQLIKNIGSMAFTISASLEVALTLTFKFDIKVEKIKNEYAIKIEEYNKQINILKNQLTIKEYHINKIENNYSKPNQLLKNPDDSLYEEMKKIYDPIEEFFANNGGFGAPFIFDIFFDMTLFANNCTLNRFKFIDKSLREIHEKLKISSFELSNILEIYTYPMKLNPGMQMFEYLNMQNKVAYMPEAYSKDMFEEHKTKYDRANELLAEIVSEYKALDDKYKELRFK